MNDAASDRDKRINDEYETYLRTKEEREAEKRLKRITGPGEDMDQKASGAVFHVLGTYPAPVKADKPLANTSAVMADNARNDTIVLVSKKYRAHRAVKIRQDVVKKDEPATKFLQHPAAYIVTVAQRTCAVQLGKEYPRGKLIHRWYRQALADPRFVRFEEQDMSKNRMETTLLGLSKWPNLFDPTKEDKVRELLDCPNEVRMREHFDVHTVVTKANFADMVEELLVWCGTSVNASELLTKVVLPWCNIEVMALDDDLEHERVWSPEQGRNTEHDVITKMYGQDLLNLITDDDNAEIIRLFYFEEKSLQEIAQETNYSVGAIQKRKERALDAMLRESIKALRENNALDETAPNPSGRKKK